MEKTIATFLTIGIAACGSPDNTGASTTVTEPTAVHSTGKPVLTYFSGVASPSGKALTLTLSSARSTGSLATEVKPVQGGPGDPGTATVADGTGANEVELHTVGNTNFIASPGAGDACNGAVAALEGVVQPINNISSFVGQFTIVMDSISGTGNTWSLTSGQGSLSATAAPAFFNFETDVFPNPPTGFLNPGPGFQSETDTSTWEFCLTSTADFTFKGHLEGTVGSS